MIYKILENFPVDYFEQYKVEWLKHKEEIFDIHKTFKKNNWEGKQDFREESIRTNQDLFGKLIFFSESFFQVCCRKKVIPQKVYDDFGDFYAMTLFIAMPGRKDPLHIDSTRSCAVNFPLVVDHDRSGIVISKSDEATHLDKFVENTSGASYPSWRDYAHDGKMKGHFQHQPELTETYDVRKPIIFNTKLPHGGFNDSEAPRIILSIGYRQDIVSALQKINKNFH